MVNEKILKNQPQRYSPGRCSWWIWLTSGFSYDWHSHENIDEIYLVIKGQGKFSWEKETVDYHEGDIFTIPANSKHKITATAKSEFYFVRIKA